MLVTTVVFALLVGFRIGPDFKQYRINTAQLIVPKCRQFSLKFAKVRINCHSEFLLKLSSEYHSLLSIGAISAILPTKREL